jgi:hypothetical protein
MTVAEAKEMVVRQYPDAVCERVKLGYGQLVSYHYQITSKLCGLLGLCADTEAAAWIKAGEHMRPNSLGRCD